MFWRVFLWMSLVWETLALHCDRSTVYRGVPCTRNKLIVTKEQCPSFAPECCEFTIGHLDCFVNRNHNGNTGNDPCNHKSHLNSIMPIAPENRAASGPILSIHYVISTLQCLDYCARNRLCYAFNYENEPRSRDFSKRACELLSHIDSVVNREHFTHQIMDQERFRNTLLQSGCNGNTID